MLWGELTIKDPISNNEIKKVFSKLFSVSPDYIHIISDLSEFADLPDKYQLVHGTKISGDFKKKLSVYLSDDLTVSHSEKMLLVKQLVSGLKTSCLISDDSPNPFSMIHIDRFGNETIVFLDPNSDEEGKIVIQKKQTE